MPFIAIIIGFGTTWILEKGRFFTTFIFSTTLTYMLLSYFILSFGFPIFPNYKYAINFPILKWTDIYYLHTFPVKVLYDPKPKLPYEQILSDIANVKNGRINVIAISGSNYVNYNILNPYLYKSVFNRRNDIYMDEFSFLETINDNESDLINYFNNNTDAIILLKNYLGPPESIREYEHLVRFQNIVLSGKLKNFKKIKEYQLVEDEYHPNDTIILLKKVF